MNSKPEIVDVPAQKVAFIHVTATQAEIMQAMHAGLDELRVALEEQKTEPTGPWFTHHLRRPTDSFDFRICFPVSQDVKPVGRVQPGMLDQARVARTIYSGPYSGLPSAWGEFMSSIKAEGLRTRDDLWERYLVGPDSSDNSSEWRTELNRPLV